jgi:hypothetical protein
MDAEKVTAAKALLDQAYAAVPPAEFMEVFNTWFDDKLMDSVAVLPLVPETPGVRLVPERVQVDFPEMEIAPRDVLPIGVFPQFLFRGEQVVATDSEDGMATNILFLFVGQKLQRPMSMKGTPTAFFGADSSNGVFKMDTCSPGLGITFWVRNNTDKPVKWKAAIRGLGVRTA